MINKTGESPTSNYDSPSERGGENDKVKAKLVCVCVMCQIVDRGHEREKWDRSLSQLTLATAMEWAPLSPILLRSRLVIQYRTVV